MKNFYDAKIKLLCKEANETGAYLEGTRDSQTGQPYGMTAWAIAAKQLWKMGQDGVEIPSLAEETSSISDIFEAFKSRYELTKDEKGKELPADIGNYVLKSA